MKLRLETAKYPIDTAAKLQQQLRTEGYSCFDWSDAPGAYYSPHSHPHDEYIVVHTGSIVFEIGGERYLVSAGDALSLPANTVHSAMNETDGRVRYFICAR